jgi:translation elongation factor EF-Tu-like GTPase
MYVLSKGPDHRARVFNRCFINGFLFRTTDIEKNLTTQNNGVVVKGDDSTSNMDWYSVIGKILTRIFKWKRSHPV